MGTDKYDTKDHTEKEGKSARRLAPSAAPLPASATGMDFISVRMQRNSPETHMMSTATSWTTHHVAEVGGMPLYALGKEIRQLREPQGPSLNARQGAHIKDLGLVLQSDDWKQVVHLSNKKPHSKEFSKTKDQLLGIVLRISKTDAYLLTAVTSERHFDQIVDEVYVGHPSLRNKKEAVKIIICDSKEILSYNDLRVLLLRTSTPSFSCSSPPDGKRGCVDLQSLKEAILPDFSDCHLEGLVGKNIRIKDWGKSPHKWEETRKRNAIQDLFQRSAALTD
ncbi:unnamed protein product, partial [Cyprideis torosa]